MAKPEWGSKRTCLNCGTRFYDMQNTPIICPKCGSENAPDAVSKARRVLKKTPAHAAPEDKPKAAALRVTSDDDDVIDDIDVEIDDDDVDDSLIEDTSDLAEDDDMAGVIDHRGTGDDD
ncbi:MAG: FYDLN acid domain-containing protein [Rhodospirillaceae bacterium]|nr:FYDLN acid domain-containing protein [Rhodospirillaceae bacterium]